MSMTAPISILTITYNNLNGLKKTLDSVFGQSFAPQEIIVIDGASTDGSVEFLSSLGTKIHWKSEQDSGISDAFNKALRLSNAEWVVFLNSGDCLAEVGTLEEMSKTLTPLPDKIGVCCGNANYVDASGKVCAKIVSLPDDLLKRSSIAHQATYIRRVVHVEVPFDLRLNTGMDYDVWLRLRGKTDFTCIDSVLAICEWGGISTRTASAIHSILLGESIRWFNQSQNRKICIRDVIIVCLHCIYVKIKLRIADLFRGRFQRTSISFSCRRK